MSDEDAYENLCRSAEASLRDCICADPENCTQPVPRRRCRKPRACPECGQPMLPEGQRRESPDDYRHARGCPNASPAERARTEKIWANLDAALKDSDA